MKRTIHIGPHELRFISADSPLIYICFAGDVSVEDARSLSLHVGQAVAAHGCRVLVNAAGLGSIPAESRRELVTAGGTLAGTLGGSRVGSIVLVGASMRQKVVLTQIIGMAGLPPTSQGQPHFFEDFADALSWLGLPPSILESA